MTAGSARPIKAISLDFYGTLVQHRDGRGRGANLVDFLRAKGLEPAPWEHRMLYEIFARHDTDYSTAVSEETRSEYRRQLAARALECLGITADRALVREHADALWRILGPDAFELYPDARPTLATLRDRGYPLALVSNWQRGLGHFVVDLGLAGTFEHTISSAELGVAKPDREIFEAACERLGARPDQVLHVGDTTLDDYEGGRAAGLRTLLLHRVPGPPPEGTDAIRDLRELPSWLLDDEGASGQASALR